MPRIILACALAGIFAMPELWQPVGPYFLTLPANALDRAPSPTINSPPVGGWPGDVPNSPYWHNPNQLQRDLMAQANPSPAATLRDQLVGAWALVSCNNAPWCANPNGIHILDASGHYATINAPLGRPVAIVSDPKGLTDFRSRVTPEQYKAIATTFQANFGTWQVDETNKTIAYHFDGSLFPNPQEETFSVSVSGDELKLGSTSSFTGTSVWRRIKK